MTHVLSPYAVDIAALRSLVGSGDERRLHSLDLTDEDLLEEIDEVDESHLGWTADPVRSTLRGLVLGEEPDRRPAHLYGYCLEVLCRILPCSTPLPSRAWTGIDFLLFMHVKAELQKAGSAFDPATLIRTGPRSRSRPPARPGASATSKQSRCPKSSPTSTGSTRPRSPRTSSPRSGSSTAGSANAPAPGAAW
ncbi:hypothetical protein ACFQXA_21240 [Nocardiopsis composta]